MPELLPMPKFEWDKLIRALPKDSPLFAHARCGTGCRRRDGSRIAPATLKHVAITLQTFANLDGTHAHPGISTMATATARHRSTVIAALHHLEVVGLIAPHLRGGSWGIPRTYATDYYLTSPDYEGLALVELPSDAWLPRPVAAPADTERPERPRTAPAAGPASYPGRYRVLR